MCIYQYKITALKQEPPTHTPYWRNDTTSRQQCPPPNLSKDPVQHYESHPCTLIRTQRHIKQEPPPPSTLLRIQLHILARAPIFQSSHISLRAPCPSPNKDCTVMPSVKVVPSQKNTVTSCLIQRNFKFSEVLTITFMLITRDYCEAFVSQHYLNKRPKNLFVKNIIKHIQTN